MEMTSIDSVAWSMNACGNEVNPYKLIYKQKTREFIRNGLQYSSSTCTLTLAARRATYELKMSRSKNVDYVCAFFAIYKRSTYLQAYIITHTHMIGFPSAPTRQSGDQELNWNSSGKDNDHARTVATVIAIRLWCAYCTHHDQCINNSSLTHTFSLGVDLMFLHGSPISPSQTIFRRFHCKREVFTQTLDF
jgi:hypothetical protein